MKKIMVVDDEVNVLQNLTVLLEKEGYTVAGFTSSVHAIKTLDAVRDINLVITDIRMPTVEGTEVLKAALNRERPVPVIVLTGYGNINTAVNLMKTGASDFISKPVSSEELIIRIKKVLEQQEITDEVKDLRRRLEHSEFFHSILGKSPRMLEVYEVINAVARTTSTVLIRGETGTGKELVARAVHAASHRKDEPFVAISCTTLQSTLLESELFGHEKGSFTGAHALKVGKLESAGHGTVFLDEVGDTSPEIQAKLLRVLQEREFERLGGLKPLKLNARVITATNMDLERAVREERFREDLYFRLNVIDIKLPPLREREGDILLLANHFLDHYKKRYQKNIKGFSPSAVEQLLEYHWPGNVRELKNALERTVLTNPRRWIDRFAGLQATEGMPGIFNPLPGRMDFQKAKESVFSELEKAYLVQYMTRERGQINKVAALMGVSTRTITRKLERYGLDKAGFKKGR